MGSRDVLADRFMAEAEKSGWWRPDATIVAAVSGGPDSMALLHLLCRLRRERPCRLIAAHVNHRFRGAESEAEAELVRRTAAEWDVTFEATSVDVPAYIEETGMNAQAAAREKRYDFLNKIASDYQAACVLFGHHADDQAETVLMRVIRGTGVGGLAGIPSRRTEGNLELVRPLLRITKGELLSYCERNEVPYAVDSSNSNRHYFRNEVRLDLIPTLERYNPRLKESLIRLADMAEADDGFLEEQAAAALPDVAVRAGGGFRLERRRFRGLHVALQRRLIKLILKYCFESWHTLEFRQIEDVLEATRQDYPAVTRFDIGGGWTFVREYEDIYMGPPLPSMPAYTVTIADFPRSVALGTGGWTIELERLDGAVTSLPDNRWEAFFDESALAMPLTVRNRLPGDRLEPAGLNGTKKVQDMFVDAKVPRSRRNDWPLLADAEGRLLWIPGLRRSRHAPVEPGTPSTIKVAVRQGSLLFPQSAT